MLKNGNGKKIIMILLIMIIIPTLFYVYTFPLQKALAEKKFTEYIALQNVDVNDIKSKSVFKEYKRGGYNIIVEYYSDELYTYEYHYFLFKNRSNGPKYNTMSCVLYDKNNIGLDIIDETVKYPPLKTE